MRIRNLYNPPTLKDYPASAPWTPDGTTSTGEKTPDGWKVTVTGSATCWLYPPQQPDGCKCVCWQKSDGTYFKNIGTSVTFPVTQAEKSNRGHARLRIRERRPAGHARRNRSAFGVRRL